MPYRIFTERPLHVKVGEKKDESGNPVPVYRSFNPGRDNVEYLGDNESDLVRKLQNMGAHVTYVEKLEKEQSEGESTIPEQITEDIRKLKQKLKEG